MQRYRKKPVEIEAMQWNGAIDSATEIVEWILANNGTAALQQSFESHSGFVPDPYIVIETLDGIMAARKRDWVIRGTEGEFYPCKPAPFAATYEPVSLLDSVVKP